MYSKALIEMICSSYGKDLVQQSTSLESHVKVNNLAGEVKGSREMRGPSGYGHSSHTELLGCCAVLGQSLPMVAGRRV